MASIVVEFIQRGNKMAKILVFNFRGFFTKAE